MTKKTHTTIRPETPYLEITYLVIVLPLAIFATKIVLVDNNVAPIWILLSVTFLACTIAMVRLINKRFKRIEITDDYLTIKSFLSLTKRRLNRLEIKGYDFKEVYHGLGTRWIVRLVTGENEVIELPIDGYKTCDTVVDKIKKSGLIFLGRTELGTNRKQLYGWLMKWGFILIPLTVAFIVYLLKDN